MRLCQWSSRAARAAVPALRHGRPDIEHPPPVNEQHHVELDDYCMVEDYDQESFGEDVELCYEDEVRHQALHKHDRVLQRVTFNNR